MAIDPSFSPIGEYLDPILKAMESGEVDKQTALLMFKNIVGEHIRGVFESLADITILHKEICSILNEFSGRNIGLFKVLTIDHLILTLKFYVIAWATIMDMIASFINKVFNLGYDNQDVKLDRVLRNKHVRQSNVAAIFDKHRNAISFGKFREHRNAIVHRGRIIDEDVIALAGEQSTLYSIKYSLLVQTNITDEEFEQGKATINKKLWELAPQKQTYFENHYNNTLKMLSEILIALGQKTLEIYGKNTK